MKDKPGGMMSKATESDKIRQLSIEQEKAIEHLLRGKSDRAVAEAAGVCRQTVWEWRNHDPLFIAELNRQRIDLWRDARERLKSLSNRALDVVESQLDSGDPKASLAAAKYILQGTRLLGETELHVGGPTTPEGVILEELRGEARKEIMAKTNLNGPMFSLYGEMEEIERKVEDLAHRRLAKALAEERLA